MLVFLFFATHLLAAPLVEINSDTVHLPLTPYIDVLEDKNGGLTIDDVVSERYAFQFAPASLAELYFGYSTSAYWLRFTVENQRDEDMRLILDVAPADIDFVDLYVVDPQTGQLQQHTKLGSATPYTDRAYRYPSNLFDLKIAEHTAHSYFIRIESDKAVNARLSLSSPREYMVSATQNEFWQGVLLGSLGLLAAVYLGLFVVYQFRAFLWHGLTLICITAIQLAWNGYGLPFFDNHETLLDHQILTPVFLSLLFSALYAQSLLKTRRRAPWQHYALSILAVLSLICAIANWFISPHISASLAAWLSAVIVIFIFAAALHANMDEIVLARRFITLRAVTIGMVLIAIFNINGLLPQGAFSTWSVAAAIVIESLVMCVVMSIYCMNRLRDRAEVSKEKAEKTAPSSIINLSDVCHELRTPISGVLGMTDLLLTGNVTEQQRNQIKTIHRSGLALLDVTNRLSDLSSIEQGTVELNNAPFELTALVESCIESCRLRAESSSVELIYHIDCGVSGFVKGDQEKLQHVLVNLLQFSLRNIEQGEVVLSVKIVENDQLMFDVHSGQNTLTEHRPLLRQRNLHSSDQLNLTIAEQYIKLMGGVLDTQLFANGGALISFCLHLEAHVGHDISADEEGALQGCRILIVDDNATYCSIIEQQAVQWGMTVQSANSGMEALAILRSYTTKEEFFDFALIDYEMPGMDGLELAAHIREDQKINSEHLLMMMLTGVSRAPNKSVLEQAGIQRALYKPLSGKSLKQALQNAVAQKNQRLTASSNLE